MLVIPLPPDHLWIVQSLDTHVLIIVFHIFAMLIIYDHDIHDHTFYNDPSTCILELIPKTPHICAEKYAKPLVFGKIAKNHRFCDYLLQCALIHVFSRLNRISDIRPHYQADVAY
jgi:hypothetical protein